MADQSSKRQGERQELATRGGDERGLSTRRYQDPFAAFDDLFERMQRQFFGASLLGALMPERGGDRGSLARAPRMEVHETEDAITLTAEMPGLTREDVTIECRGDVLTIQGEKRSEDERDGARTQRWVSFYRQLPIPEDVDVDQGQASFENGLLTLQFPKRQAREASRSIPITGAQEQRGAEGQPREEQRAA
ncbi:MAG: Hsp20/alpha crystallin family protein [Candidatus Rokubacteria bacterium]|nr:Hsp20/alpha crystallin family protein [Candidatus Rokubacteria bacterium]